MLCCICIVQRDRAIRIVDQLLLADRDSLALALPVAASTKPAPPKSTKSGGASSSSVPSSVTGLGPAMGPEWGVEAFPTASRTMFEPMGFGADVFGSAGGFGSRPGSEPSTNAPVNMVLGRIAFSCPGTLSIRVGANVSVR